MRTEPHWSPRCAHAPGRAQQACLCRRGSSQPLYRLLMALRGAQRGVGASRCGSQGGPFVPVLVSSHGPVSCAQIWFRSRPWGSEDCWCPGEGIGPQRPLVTLPRLAPTQPHVGNAMGKLCVGLLVWEAQRASVLMIHGEGTAVPQREP